MGQPNISMHILYASQEVESKYRKAHFVCASQEVESVYQPSSGDTRILYASREVESVLKTALLPLSLSLSLSLTHSLFLFLSFSLSVMDFIWTSASQGFPPKLQWRHVYQPRAEKKTNKIGINKTRNLTIH